MKCPCCDSEKLEPFYQVRNVPVNSVLLLTQKEEALNFPTGDIQLALCRKCGFVTNSAFQPDRLEYSARYEGTQAYSPTFNAFNKKLARFLIEKYQLHQKVILEIGCGQGEFLELLCEMGNNQGIGFDPAFTKARSPLQSKRVNIIEDFYSEKYKHIHADFICCKMTLEHIHDTKRFVQMVRNTVNGSQKTLVFFQVPNARRIWQEVAFWDVYYEHCSYFCDTSISSLFRRCGFEPVECWTDYEDQYLMIASIPSQSDNADISYSLETIVESIHQFSQRVLQQIAYWRKRVYQWQQEGKRIVLWGGGSKAVSFLTTLKLSKEIQYAVDVNPFKQGTYLAGTGQEVVPPTFLLEYQPHVIIVMNRIYESEVGKQLDEMGINAHIFAL